MALALYRKYRPATFAEVVGQEHVTEPLRTALSSGRINHAYLFSGPRGCGKTSSARILARSLNCAQGPTPDPCGECESCVALAPEGSGSVDVVELDAASHGGVDDTRELRDRAFYAPAQSRYRIFIIDEAHMVTTQGFNALLKIVEEPPEHLIFVFATTEPDKVLPTIKSRTHHYPFRLIPPGTLRELLERICADEHVTVEPAVYPLVIRAGGGSVRDTLSVLDQLLAGADDRGVTYTRAVALLGVTDSALIDDMVDALAAHDAAAVYGTVDRLVEAGHDPRRFSSDLLDRLRDLVLLNSVPDAVERGLVDASGETLTKMQSQADQLGAATLSRFAEIVHTGLAEMRGATAPRLLLELLCARMLLPTVSDAEAAVLQRLERVERRMTIAPAGEAEAAPPSGGQPAGAAAPSGAQPEGARPEAGQPEVAGAGRRVFKRPHERGAEERGAEPTPSAPEAPARQPAEPASASSPTPAPAVAPAPPPEAPPEAPAASGGGFDAAEVRRVWTELLREVAERNRPTQALLLNATVQDLRDGVLVLSMPTAGLAKQFAQQHRIAHVQDALRAVLGGEWDVQCVEAGAAPSHGSAAQNKQNTPNTQNPQSRQNSAEPRSSAPSQPAAAPRAVTPAPDSGASPQRQEQRQGSKPSGEAASSQATASAAAGGSGPNGAHSDSTAAQQRGNATRGARRSAASPDDDVPPPPEPPPEEEPPPPEDYGAPKAAASPGGPPPSPDEAAVELFASEFGAHKID